MFTDVFITNLLPHLLVK